MAAIANDERYPDGERGVAQHGLEWIDREMARL
jgi:hypothetical protein